MSSTVLRQTSTSDSLAANGLNVGSGGIVVLGGAIATTGNVVTQSQYQFASTNFTAPSTAPASANLQLSQTGGGNTVGTPVLRLTVASANPNLVASQVALSVYPTTAATAPAPANSYMVARPFVSSLPQFAPPNSQNNFVGAGVVTAVAVPTITANSQVQVWLLGASAAAFTAGITAPAIVVTATGFTHNATAGAIYGYQVFYA